MLNKELLLGESSDVPHMVLHVGNYNDEYYGWDDNLNMGAVNRRPVWYGYALRALWSDPFADLSTIGFTTNQSAGFKLSAIVEGKTLLFKTRPFGGDAEVSGTLFDYDMLGKRIAVYFDPPPNGTWIPLRANLSRRLLRRRSSLGGSRC